MVFTYLNAFQKIISGIQHKQEMKAWYIETCYFIVRHSVFGSLLFGSCDTMSCEDLAAAPSFDALKASVMDADRPLAERTRAVFFLKQNGTREAAVVLEEGG